MDIEISGVNIKTPALEVIDFQDMSFGLTLEKYIETIVKDIHIGRIEKLKSLKNRTEIKDIEEIIKDRIGLNVKLVIENNTPAAAITPKIGLHNLADYKQFRKLKDDFKAVDKILSVYEKSVVDNKEVKVTGGLSKLENKLYINFLILVKHYKLNVKEITAILLHELGHIFTYYEYMSKMAEVNIILEDAFKMMSNKDLKSPEVILYKKLKTIDIEIEKDIVRDIVKGKSFIPILAIGKLYSSILTSTFTASYNDRSSERLADLFSSRFGYGKYLANGLDKLYKKDGIEDYYRTIRLFSIISFIIDLIKRIVFILTTSKNMKGKFINIFISIVISIVFSILFSSTSTKQETYDDIKTRYIKLRNDIVRYLKNVELSIEDKKAVLDDIKAVDEIINDSNYLDKDLTNIMLDYLYPRSKLYRNKFNRQELLEELETNDLFIQSAELETI